MRTIREMASEADPSLVWELYGVEKGRPPSSLGTFNLDVESSLSALLEGYGEVPVLSHQAYKAYMLVYINL